VEDINSVADSKFDVSEAFSYSNGDSVDTESKSSVGIVEFITS
jgi:hypothetical protein